MSLAGIFNIPGDPDELHQWAFDHMANHRDILKAIREQYGLLLNEYPLDPIPPNDLGVWSYQHQIMHDQMNQVLGISGLNLTNVDWDDVGQRTAFVYSNATLHREASGLLGIG